MRISLRCVVAGFLVGCLLGYAVAGQAAQVVSNTESDQNGAVKFVDQFYSWLFKKEDQTITLDKIKRHRKWFDEGLIALWDGYERRVPAGEVGCLDIQPFTAAQDDVDSFHVEKIEPQGDGAVVDVNIFYGSDSWRVSVVLKRSGNSWQIFDVYSRAKGMYLKKLLSE